MSSEKEPADVAMEFLADDPAFPSQGRGAGMPVAFKTAQDLLDWVQSDPDRNSFQRSNKFERYSRSKRILNMPLAAIPADEQHLLNVCYKAVRADKSLKKRSAMKSSRFKPSPEVPASSRSGPGAPAIPASLGSSCSGRRPDRNDQYGLSPFASLALKGHRAPRGDARRLGRLRRRDAQSLRMQEAQ